MNRGVARWVLAVSGAGFLLFALLLPPERASEGWYGWLDGSERADLRAATRKVWAARDRVQAVEARWLRAAARERAAAAAARVRGPLTVLAGVGVLEATRSRLDATAREELSALNAPVPHHAIVITTVVDTSNASVRYARETVLPATDDSPCTVIVRINDRRQADFGISAEDRLLGTCAFHAAYGAPGAGMRRWLLDTRMLRAEYLLAPPSLAADSSLIRFSMYNFTAEVSLKGCRAGRAEHCAAQFTPIGDSTVMSGDSRSALSAALWSYPDVSIRGPGEVSLASSVVVGGLLAALAKDLGPQRFGAIWKGEQSPEETFLREEGRPLAAWVADYVRLRTEAYSPGPGVESRQLLLGLAIIALGSALAATRTRRTLS